MLMSMVGETLDSGDEVTGARVVDKSKKGTKMYRIELWFRSQKVSSREELYKNLLATLQESSQVCCCYAHNTPSHLPRVRLAPHHAECSLHSSPLQGSTRMPDFQFRSHC